MARSRPLRGLTETKEGRLAVIVVVGGLLVVGLRVADLVATHKADDAADDVRRALRAELRPLPDDDLAVGASPEGSTVEEAAERALAPLPARLLALGEGEDEDTPSSVIPVVLVVETGWGWQARCIRAELTGHNTVLTEVRSSHC